VITADATGVKIVCGRFSSKVEAMKASEFPTLVPCEGPCVMVGGAALVKLIEETRYAVSDRGQTSILEAALLKMTGGSMGMIATDKKRLSISTASREPGEDCSVVIPRKTLDVLRSMNMSQIELSIGTNHLFFTSGDRMLTSRTLEGKYIAYERIIPRHNDKTATINRSDLAAAIRRVGVASELNCQTYFSFDNGLLTLRSRSAEVGEADEEVEIEYDGPRITLSVSWRYVLDFLNAAEGTTVTVALRDEKTAMLFSDGPSFINVVSTMKG